MTWSPKASYRCLLITHDDEQEDHGTLNWYDVVRLVYHLEEISIEQSWAGNLLVSEPGVVEPKWIVPLPLPPGWKAGRLTA